MKSYTVRSIALYSLALVTNAQASFFDDYMIDPDDGMLDASKYLSEVPLGFLPVPTIITEPATGNGLGVVGVFFHESEEQKKQRIDKSSSKGHYVLPKNISLVGLGATENGSKGAGVGHMGYWYEDRLRYKGYALYPDFNLDFYSLGGTDLPKPVELNITGPVVIQELKARLGDSHWFAGGHQVYRTVETTLTNSDELQLLPDSVPGNHNLNSKLDSYLSDKIDSTETTSGLGFILEYDSRNNPMSPSKGYDYQFEVTRFDEGIGSDVDYNSYHFEGLNYWSLSKHFDFALRLQYDAVDADDDQELPTYVPPSIDLRGVPAMRYQGNSVALGEIELTYKLNKRWKFNTFTGTGRAAQSFSDLNDSDSAENYGIGFRYLIAKRYGFSMGADIAKGPEDTAFYIQAGSTW
jgi:hypothetical protein